MVSQKIMGAFLPLCQRRERGSVWGVGVKGFSFPVPFSWLLLALPCSPYWGQAGVPPARPHPLSCGGGGDGGGAAQPPGSLPAPGLILPCQEG